MELHFCDVHKVLFSRCRTEPFDRCWEYQGYRNPKGYGRLAYRGKSYYAHRLTMMFVLQRDLSPTEVVMHKCDNPCCCNPSHLELGDFASNIQDRVSKCRTPKRGRHNRLEGHQVLRIRMLSSMGMNIRAISDVMQLPESTTRNVVKMKVHRDVVI